MNQVEIQVVLEYQWTSTRDLISDVKASMVDSGEEGPQEGHQTSRITSRVTLRSIIESLADKGLDIEPEHRISFQDPAKSLYVFVGKAADQSVLDSYTLPASAFSQGSDGPVLTLLIRKAGSGLSGQKPPSESIAVPTQNDCQKKLFDSLAPASLENDTVVPKKELRSAHKDDSVKIPAGASATKASKGSPTGLEKSPSFMDAIDLKRTKERQIRFVVERVSLWRKLYNGVELGNGETVRYSLEDSARLVGISKKSLDDYLLQLRFGRMYGFDFLKHQCDNIGVLRKFVREHKQKQKRVQQKQSKDEVQEQEMMEQDQCDGMQTPTKKPEIIDQGMVDESSRDNSQQLV